MFMGEILFRGQGAMFSGQSTASLWLLPLVWVSVLDFIDLIHRSCNFGLAFRVLRLDLGHIVELRSVAGSA